MLCDWEAPTPPTMSGSNWLDRLRSNKGIPTGDNLDLDFFLCSGSNPSDSPKSNSGLTQLDQNRASIMPQTPGISCSNEDRQWVGIMSSVLSELFIMGNGPSRSSYLPGKKYSRKQAKPRFFLTSSFGNDKNNNGDEKGYDCARNEENVAAMNSSSSGIMETQEENKDRSEAWEKEKDEKEFPGYSRSEVTVIDTSLPVWKVDKLVLRRKNVWKVREKKGKSKFFGRKKRKGSFGIEQNGLGRGLKKSKLWGSQPESSKPTNCQDFMASVI